jgi:hypothetical protein
MATAIQARILSADDTSSLGSCGSALELASTGLVCCGRFEANRACPPQPRWRLRNWSRLGNA